MAGNVSVITDQDWQKKVTESQLPVVVDFTATWCGPCKFVAPIVEQLSQEMAGKVSFGKLDIDQSPEMPIKYGIEGVPTLVLFKGGQEVDRMVGAAPKPAIQGWLEERLAG
jgi:thioredoxin 1